MIRRQILFGVTLVLLAVVIFLLLRGRREEKAREARNLQVEQVRDEAPSPTRVLAPRDLELVETNVSFAPAAPAPPRPAGDGPTGEGQDGEGGGKETGVTAHHSLTVRNTGSVAYGGLRLRLEYTGKSGKVLAERIQAVDGALPPKGTLRLEDVAVEDVPPGAAGCRTTVVSADLALD